MQQGSFNSGQEEEKILPARGGSRASLSPPFRKAYANSLEAQSSFATTIIRAIREIMQNACPFTSRPGCATRGTWPRRRGNANDNSTRGLNNSSLSLCPFDSCENWMYDARWYCDLKRLGAPLALEEKGSSSLKKSSFENVEMKVSVMKMCSIGTTIFLLLWFLSRVIFCNRLMYFCEKISRSDDRVQFWLIFVHENLNSLSSKLVFPEQARTSSPGMDLGDSIR